MSRLQNLISSLNGEIKKLETKRKRLLAIRERTFEDVNLLISEISEGQMEREILSLFMKDGINDIDMISEILDIRKASIEQVLNDLKRILDPY